jgi:hypothetical protein
MAVTRRRLEPKVPALDSLDPATIGIDYHAAQDTLFVHFSGSSTPAISKYVDDDTIYRLDPVTEEVVGVEVENFLSGLLSKTAPNAESS